jgi:N6-adenosine-specific RNA methylase IME4
MENVLDSTTYEIIVIDPPYSYAGNKGTPNRFIENHYPTMSLQDLISYPVKPAKDAILFLWVPPALLEDGLALVKAYGFTYKTHMVWDKVKLGAGYWARIQHEDILIGLRGGFTRPPSSKYIRSVVSKKRTEHSRKPEYLQDWIEQAWPDKTKAEYFARRPRKGWHVFGNEVENGAQQQLPSEDRGLS